MKTKTFIIAIGYFLFIGIMIFLAHLWNDTWNNILYNGSRGFFLENRAEDIKMVTSCVFKEELIWRCLPIFIASIILASIKTKWIKLTIGTILFATIIYIQIIFGAKHYSPLAGFPCINYIIMQGGTGIILTITYTYILYYILKKIPNKSTIKKFFIANVLAYSASCAVHAASNIIIVITQTF